MDNGHVTELILITFIKTIDKLDDGPDCDNPRSSYASWLQIIPIGAFYWQIMSWQWIVGDMQQLVKLSDS